MLASAHGVFLGGFLGIDRWADRRKDRGKGENQKEEGKACVLRDAAAECRLGPGERRETLADPVPGFCPDHISASAFSPIDQCCSGSGD